MQRRCAGRVEGWTEIKFADELRVGDVGNVEIHHCRRISHRCHLAVQADIGRSMKSLRPLRFGLARLLSRHPPATSLLRMRRIAYVQNHQDVRAKARRGGRQVGVLAARVRVACVPVAPVFQCESCQGLTGSLMSQIRTPSSLGLFGSAPHASDDFSSAVTMMLSWSVIWMVQVFFGPWMVFTNFGSFGSVTSTMLQP